MAQFSAQLRNSDVKRFNSLTASLKKFARDDFYTTMQNGASRIVRKAKTRVPVKTGDLKRSIGVDGNKQNIIIKADMQYAGYVEFGTQRQKAKPYFYNSIREEIKTINIDINRKLKKLYK